MEAFRAPGKTPTRNTVNTVISRQNDKIERVFSGRMENPVFRLKRAYIEEHEDEFPTPEEIADHAAHQVAEALGTMYMPLVPNNLATEIRTRLARFAINGKFTTHDFQMEQKAVQDLVMADRDNWLGLRKVGWLSKRLCFSTGISHPANRPPRPVIASSKNGFRKSIKK